MTTSVRIETDLPQGQQRAVAVVRQDVITVGITGRDHGRIAAAHHRWMTPAEAIDLAADLLAVARSIDPEHVTPGSHDPPVDSQPTRDHTITRSPCGKPQNA